MVIMGTTTVEFMFNQLSLAQKSSTSLDSVEEDYVLNISSQNGDGNYIAATSSDFSARLFSKDTLAVAGVVKGHTDVLSDICWGKSDINLLFTSSKDKTVRCWDTRMKLTKEVQSFKGSEECVNVYTCVDINLTDQVLCAGQEVDKDGNVFLHFWDRRQTEVLGAYSESHQDDITQVKFHPTQADKLISGSTDGLVCLYDISETCEDDALSYTFNSCSTVASIGWCGDRTDQVYCTTHIDTLHVWDTIEGDDLYENTDLKEILKDKNSIDYIVDLIVGEGDKYLVLAGKHNGEMRVIELSSSDKVSSVICNLSGGHKATIRCLYWNNKDKYLVTGAEDSLLCLWSACGNKLDTATSDGLKKAKMKNRKTVSKRSHPY
ncbi:WD repeat-containing protein 89 [Mactra antiquata]